MVGRAVFEVTIYQDLGAIADRELLAAGRTSFDNAHIRSTGGGVHPSQAFALLGTCLDGVVVTSGIASGGALVGASLLIATRLAVFEGTHIRSASLGDDPGQALSLQGARFDGIVVAAGIASGRALVGAGGHPAARLATLEDASIWSAFEAVDPRSALIDLAADLDGASVAAGSAQGGAFILTLFLPQACGDTIGFVTDLAKITVELMHPDQTALRVGSASHDTIAVAALGTRDGAAVT